MYDVFYSILLKMFWNPIIKNLYIYIYIEYLLSSCNFQSISSSSTFLIGYHFHAYQFPNLDNRQPLTPLNWKLSEIKDLFWSSILSQVTLNIEQYHHLFLLQTYLYIYMSFSSCFLSLLYIYIFSFLIIKTHH